jgi:hypothetical protein
MRIKYTKKDPRRGSIAEVSEQVGQRLIKQGAAEKATRDDKGDPETTPAKQLANTARKARKAAKKAAKAKD